MAFQPSAQTSLDRLARQSATPRTLERFDSTPAFSPLQLSSWPRPQPQKTTTRSSLRRLLRRRLASTRAKLQGEALAPPGGSLTPTKDYVRAIMRRASQATPFPRAGTPAPQCGTGVLARRIAECG